MWSNCFCFVLVTPSQLRSQPVFQNLLGIFICLLPGDVNKPENGLFQKKIKMGGWRGLRIYFCENSPGIFHFFTLPLEIPDKTKLNPWIFHKIVLDPLEIPRPKTKTHGNSTLFFLVTLGNSTEIPPLEIPYPQPAVWIFSGISQLIILHLVLFYYLLIIIADQTCYSIGRQRVIGQINIQQSSFQLAVSLSSVTSPGHSDISAMFRNIIFD